MQKKSFRKDINGLRALAVLSVVIFHFNKDYLPGGFAGVDIFFVISGYLMTSIIFKGIENNNFSIFKFIISRANRIVPALTYTILFLLLIGYLFFEPLTYQLIGKHAVSSLLFISNYIYASESGYFDLASNTKSLLHTWSLSVEWQFYIIYPVVIILLSKIINLNTIKIVISLLTTLSFLASMYFSFKNPTVSYFMLYTRAWEMMIGGVIFFYPIKFFNSKNYIFEKIGILLILISFIIISEKTKWPGYMSVIPIFGTFLCMQANRSNTFFSNGAIQYLGLISYSVYLVHWPILVFLNKNNFTPSLPVYLLIVLIASYILHTFVEKKRSYNYRFFILYLIVLISSVFIEKDGIKNRVDDKYRLTSTEFHSQYYGGNGIKSDGMIQEVNLSKGTTPSFIITGDSFARQYMNFFKNEQFVAIFKDGCFSGDTFMTSLSDISDSACNLRFTNFKKAMLEYKTPNVIYMQAWQDEAKLLNKKTGESLTDKDGVILIKELNMIINSMEFNSVSDRKLFIVGNPPGSQSLVFECKAKEQLPVYKFLKSSCDEFNIKKESNINNILKKWAGNYDNVYFIDPSVVLCDENKCRIQTNDGEPIYSDFHHLSIYGAQIVGPYIKKEIKK